MISHTNKCLFVHIPKVAGTSIIEVLQDKDFNEKSTQKNAAPFSANDFKFDPPPPHFRASDYVKYGQLTQKQFENYYKFSFVRNPWARIVSEYKYRDHARKYPFKDFLFKHLPTPAWRDEYCHIIPQYDFLYDEEGNCLVDFIGKFENIQQDFHQVCKSLDLPETQLPHSNQSQSLFHLRYDAGFCELLKRVRGKLSKRQRQNTFSNYREYYDQECIEFVAELYKNDIQAFQYEFDN